jgi:hypothetical protein
MSLYDPLNEPPPVSRRDLEAAVQRAANKLAEPPKTPLEQFMADLSRSHRWRIRRMISDHRWIRKMAAKRGVSFDE